MLRRLFRDRQRPRSQHTLEDVELLEKAAAVLPAEQRAGVLYHTADLYSQIRQPARALSAYGRAIDEYLESGRFSAAATVCRRLLEVHPPVVRARGTLAFLELSERLAAVPAARALAESDELLAGYVRASRAAGREQLAGRRLEMLARTTESFEVQERISELLSDLGDTAGAEEVFLTAYEERHDLRPRRSFPGTQSERWAQVLGIPLAAHSPPGPRPNR